ncbi:Paraquat-inducible protein A [gamma proteobacterium IMCC1989]|nr:Paraquat-inducible protein A [gamma proteobacterium IMCC1989]
MHDYGRWAMLDVMVVAVLIVASKLSVLASVEVHVGLYVFGLSVILVMLLTQRAVKLANA